MNNFVDIFCVMYFEKIIVIYLVYFEVGSDIVEINIFGVFLVGMMDFDLLLEFVDEINVVVVVCVCKVVDEWIEWMLDKFCFVVGVIGFIS